MALTLTVRPGDTISIGDDILVQFVKNSGNNTFRLNIVAPDNKKIIRHKTVGLPDKIRK